MKRRITSLLIFTAITVSLWAQSPASQDSVPNLVKFSGSIASAPAGSVGVIFALYKDQNGGAPLWQEVQTVTVDASGRYTALLGASTTSGIPVDLFSSNEARWLGVQPQGQAEQSRVLLVSVPYAIKAADAQTLGGLPASAFLRADGTTTNNTYINQNAVTSAVAGIVTKPALTATGATAGFLPVFTDAAGDIANSALFQRNVGTVANPVWNLGLGTTTPIFNFQFVSTVDPAAVVIDGYGIVGINYIGRRARGTIAAPTAILANDNIMAMQGRGYGTTTFSPSSRANMKFFAAENWTDAAQGTYISLATTPKGTAAAAERFRILDNGNVGIGTIAPANPLSVNGIVESTVGGFKFPDGTVQLTAGGGGGGGGATLGNNNFTGLETITGSATAGANALTVTTSATNASAIVATANDSSSTAITAVGKGNATGLVATSELGLGLHVKGSNAQIDGLTESGNESLAAPPDTPCTAASCLAVPTVPYSGMLLRRVKSDDKTAGAVVAYALLDATNPAAPAGVSLQRDGSNDGFVIVPDPTLTGSVGISYSCQGFDASSAPQNVHQNFVAAAGPQQVYSSGLGLLFFQCMFGRLADSASMTEVTFSRFNTITPTWVGRIISDTNQ